MSIRRKILILIAAFFSLLTLSTTVVVTYAYFTSLARVITPDGNKKVAKIGMEISLLFDRLDSNSVNGATLPTGVTYSKDATWGSKENPYIISDIRHLQNLSALQSIGYFAKLFTNANMTGDTYNGGTSMPYFLVCNPDGTPVTIDGTNITIKPIGDDTYPFVGFVGGSFTDSYTSIGKTGLKSEESTIYNITVQTDTDIVDVGLFGTVAYQGNKPTSADATTFEGISSTITDLLLYDVKVKVDNPTIVDKIAAAITNHREWSYSNMTEGQDAVSHENHHIGILAGHVEYSTVQHISVYYSTDDVVAIDVAHSTGNGYEPNYYSAGGIMGYMYNMNPEISGTSISIGSGSSSDDSFSTGGAGSGGGSLSGTGRGYCAASDVVASYNYSSTGQAYEDGDLVIRQAYDENGNALAQQYIRKKVLFGGTEETKYYYFYDGVFTFSLSSDNDKIVDTWTNEDGTADKFYVDANNDSSWKKNTTKGNSSVVAFVKDINNQTELNAAISANKQIYIGYESSGSVSMMSLAEDFSTNNAINANDNYSTKAITKKFVDSEERDSIGDTLKSVYQDYQSGKGEPNEGLLPRTYNKTTKKYDVINTDVINNISNYRVINLGSSEDLEKIKNNFPIDASVSNGSYTFFNSVGTKNYLALLAVKGVFTGYKYSIFTGSSKASYWGGSTYWVTTSTVSFQSNGTATIRYDYSSESAYRYVYFSSDSFKGTTSTSNNTILLRFYTVEGTSNMNFGRITYEPKENIASKTYSADQVLLYPTQTYSGSNERTVSHATYELVQLQGEKTEEELSSTGLRTLYGNSTDETASIGWKNKMGENLDMDDLHKKFELAEGITWGISITIWGGNRGTDGWIVAPVGSTGAEANIPSGSIAFKINKKGTNKIRVIVSIPRCEYYEDEDEYDLSDGSYYFGYWKLPANGEQIISTFNVDNAVEKFELPKSRPYEPSSTAGESDYILIKNSDGTTSRCYLNGSQVLVAYEFVVETTETNQMYVLGSTNGPMNIVYFSADGTASEGRDGSSGSKLGSIDYVYSYGGKVITVTDSTEDDGTTGEDYSKYYASLCLLYTKNSIAYSINDFQITIRRIVKEDGTGTQIIAYAYPSSGEEGQIDLIRYSVSSDEIEITTLTNKKGSG